MSSSSNSNALCSQLDGKTSFTETLSTILENYILFVITACLLISFPLALIWIANLIERTNTLGHASPIKVSEPKNQEVRYKNDAEMKDVGRDDREPDNEGKADEDDGAGEEDDVEPQRSFEFKKLRLLMEDSKYEKRKQRSFELEKLQMSIGNTTSQKDSELTFELEKIRLNIESLEREKERDFELRKMELESQRLEMGRRLENEGKAIDLANSRVLLDLKRTEEEGRRSGHWTPSSTIVCGSDYEVVGNE